MKTDKEEKSMFLLKAAITGHSEAGISTVYITKFKADFVHHKTQSEHHCTIGKKHSDRRMPFNLGQLFAILVQ